MGEAVARGQHFTTSIGPVSIKRKSSFSSQNTGTSFAHQALDHELECAVLRKLSISYRIIVVHAANAAGINAMIEFGWVNYDSHDTSEKS